MKRVSFGFVLLVIAVSLAGFNSCDSGSSSGVPDEAARTAASIFSMIGEYLLVEDFPPPPEVVPDGITFDEDIAAGERTMTLDGFVPEPGMSVSGEIFISGLNSTPITLTITVNLTATGSAAKSVIMNATAIWAAGDTLDDEPSSVTGTFTYNGKTYSIRDIMEAIRNLSE